MKNEKDIEERL